MIIGGIPWLARITDKARARQEGRIGEYLYPWGADQHFLEEVQMSVEVFTELVGTAKDDDDVIEKMKVHLDQLRQQAEKDWLCSLGLEENRTLPDLFHGR